jgi:hypothetical protein
MRIYLSHSLLEKLFSAGKEERIYLSEELITRLKKNVQFFTGIKNLTQLCLDYPDLSESIQREVLIFCEEVFPFTIEVLNLSLSLIRDKKLSSQEAFDLATAILGKCNELLGYSENLQDQNLLPFTRLSFKSK